MATIVAFQGVLYDQDRVDEVKKVTAPPYDIISPAEQESYYNDSPYNVIRLILGKQNPDDSDTDNRYTRAAAFFKQWQQESILKRDAAPCLYSYYQEFNGPEGRMTRDGFIALVRLEEREEGVIIPKNPGPAQGRPAEADEGLLGKFQPDLFPLFRSRR